MQAFSSSSCSTLSGSCSLSKHQYSSICSLCSIFSAEAVPKVNIHTCHSLCSMLSVETVPKGNIHTCPTLCSMLSVETVPKVNIHNCPRLCVCFTGVNNWTDHGAVEKASGFIVIYRYVILAEIKAFLKVGGTLVKHATQPTMPWNDYSSQQTTATGVSHWSIRPL